jgi:predicted GNAT family N-acyltransferase
MQLLTRFLKKLLPLKVDMLVFYFPGSEQDSPKPEIDGNKLIQKGNEFQLLKNNDLIHRSRVFFKSNLLDNFNFSKPYVIIGDCFTDDRYRGRGIYPLVIRYLADIYCKENQVYILVSPDNLSSIKGIEKAGFRFMANLQGIRILFFYIQKKVFIWRS